MVSPPLPSGTPGRNVEASSSGVVRAASLLALLVCALMAYWLGVLREHRIEFAGRHLQLQAAAVAEHADVVFRSVDASLRHTLADLRDDRIAPASALPILRMRISGDPYLRSLSLVDGDGRVLASSSSDPPPAAAPAASATPGASAGVRTVQDAPALGAAAPDAPALDAAALRIALRVEETPANPANDREAIVLSRAVPGAPHGVARVVARVDNRFIAEVFSRLAFESDAQVGLYTRDGARLGGDLDLNALTPRTPTAAALLGQLLQANRAGTTMRGAFFAAAQPLDAMPLIVVAARDRRAVMAPWHQYVTGALIATVSALGLLALLVRRLESERRARLQAQAALEATRERTRLAFEAAHEGTWSWDLEQAVLELSPRMAELLGAASPQIPQAFLFSEHVHRDDRELIAQALAAHLDGRAPQLVTQFRVATSAGGWNWIHLRGRASRDAAGRVLGIAGTASDETEARRRSEQLQELQARLQRARRLESLGRFAGGIAHDFNNVLVGILGFAELLQQQLAPASPEARHVEQVLRAGERGKRLVARILAFSRGGARALTPVAISPLVAEALDLVAATLPPEVRLERALQAPDAIVLGEATQLLDAVGNLCTNALHAMPRGGRLQVTVTQCRVAAARALSHGTLAPGNHACISVADDGTGIDAEVLEHLFEPFFTTRESQGGTGLGLAMVHGAVRDMNGVIDVVSTTGRGSTFTLCFPLFDAANDAAVAAAPPGSGQVVMVVDDEPALVELAEETLAALGYEAVGFVDPSRALAAWREAPERFDALVTDHVMPGISGAELAREVRMLRPDLPILLLTGYCAGDLAERVESSGIVVLRKPLQPDQLAAQLSRLLMEPAQA